MRRNTKCWVWYFLASVCAGQAFGETWHHPLYLDGGGWWAGRIGITISNDKTMALEGEPVAVAIGDEAGQAPLAGKLAESVRVVSAAGAEMLFAVRGPDGQSIEQGPIPAGSRLIVPAECPAKGNARYYAYFDNPSAGRLPDFLSARTEVENGDVERGDGETPTAWHHDAADDSHRASWTSDRPQSGRRCLKTVVAPGAEATWISTRQTDIHIVGGAKYRMTGWVRGEDVVGGAGWYIHLGNEQNSMLTSPMLMAGEGTFDWKQVSAEFTAPQEATRADLGTVLRGTGTAWFDNVAVERLEPGTVRAVADRPETMRLRVLGMKEEWHRDLSQPAAEWKHRAVVRVYHFGDEPVEKSLVAVDLGLIAARARARLNLHSLIIRSLGRTVPYVIHGNSMLIDAAIPSRSVQTFFVYFSDDAEIRTAATAGDRTLAAQKGNLARNAGFESGEPLPEGWSASGPAQGTDGVTYALDPAGRSGRAAKLHIPSDAAEAWRGWRQDVAVKPGGTYLVSAWIKGEDVGKGGVRIHAHLRDAEGQLSATGGYTSVGDSLEGTFDWTLVSGKLTMPEDVANLQIHLTGNVSGTLWHDEVLVAEVTPGSIAWFEGAPMESDRLVVWPVPAVEKVFPDTPAGEAVSTATLTAARNEEEPLQIALRSGRAIGGVKVEVDLPAGPQGAKLEDVRVNVVGYVPIDYPTNYYQADTPAWRRKSPISAAACDGWPGLWPDPLLPRDTLDLAANVTRSVWITFRVGKETPPGDYAGKVRLTAAGATLAEIPLAVHIWDFTLPDESHVKAIYDVRLGRSGAGWEPSIEEAYPEIVRFMHKHRLCPDEIRPYPTFRQENGRVVADFAAYDRAAEWYFNELGLPHSYTPWNFYLFGWGHPPKTVFGERPYPGDSPFEGADRSQLRPEYKRVYQEMLRLFWDHLKEKGWQDKVVLYISDEPYDQHEHIREQMKALCAMIHEVDPDIPIYSSTWKHVPEWDDALDVWGIGHYGIVPTEKIGQIRSRGDRVWFTTDGQMCTDTPYCAVERLLPHYCFRYGAEAYEFWGVAWLTYDPYRFGWHAYINQSGEPGKFTWVRYPNGDGYLLYPGKPLGHDDPVSSIRFEQAREGVEDYEYLYRLRQLAEEASAAGRDASVAERALSAAASLIEIPNRGGRYSSAILPDPERLYEVRRKVAAAIEQLKDD